MSNVVSLADHKRDDAAKEAKKKLRRYLRSIRLCARRTFEDACAIGELLADAKGTVAAAGMTWRGWLETVGFSESTARNYINLFNAQEENGAQPLRTVAEAVGLKELYEILRIEENEEREVALKKAAGGGGGGGSGGGGKGKGKAVTPSPDGAADTAGSSSGTTGNGAGDPAAPSLDLASVEAALTSAGEGDGPALASLFRALLDVLPVAEILAGIGAKLPPEFLALQLNRTGEYVARPRAETPIGLDVPPPSPSMDDLKREQEENQKLRASLERLQAEYNKLSAKMEINKVEPSPKLPKVPVAPEAAPLTPKAMFQRFLAFDETQRFEFINEVATYGPEDAAYGKQRLLFAQRIYLWLPTEELKADLRRRLKCGDSPAAKAANGASPAAPPPSSSQKPHWQNLDKKYS